MRSIILFRHGKSDWEAKYSKDHERPLAKRGIKAAKKMGQLLSKRNETPDLLISSTALRARKTAELATNNGKWTADTKYEKLIYGGSVNTLLSILKKQNDMHETICLVGHEPIFSSFIEKITNTKWIKFPTAAMAKIIFKTDKWDEIELKPEKCDMNWFIKPKDLDQ